MATQQGMFTEAEVLTPEELERRLADALTVVEEWVGHRCKNECGECGVYEEYCVGGLYFMCASCGHICPAYMAIKGFCPKCGECGGVQQVCHCPGCGCCNSEVITGWLCGDGDKMFWCDLDNPLHDTEEEAQECVRRRIDEYIPPKPAKSDPKREKDRPTPKPEAPVQPKLEQSVMF